MRAGVIINDRHVHHLDHLLPLAAILDIPAYLTDPDLFDTGKMCYPDVDLHYIAYKDFSPFFLAQEFDAVISSSKLWRHELGGMTELLTGKKLRFIYCPHGNSDKGNCNDRFEPYRCQEFALIYGQQMVDRNREWGVKLEIETRMGNYRHAYYTKQKKHFDQLIENLLEIPEGKRTLLYAPTWNDSSLFDMEKKCLLDLPEDYFLILKLHPYIKQTDPATYTKIEGMCENHSRIAFFDKLPLIYPILEKCDGYIGDMSSIGYDFLHYNRPMFFLGERDVKKPLFSVGHHLEKFDWQEIEAHWNQKGLSEKRKELYRYSFDEVASLTKLKEKVRNELLTHALH